MLDPESMSPDPKKLLEMNSYCYIHFVVFFHRLMKGEHERKSINNRKPNYEDFQNTTLIYKKRLNILQQEAISKF
jgi:hypothetical protein